MSTLKPLGNRVLVKKQPEEETSKGGIILTGSDKDKQCACGEVLAVGPGSMEGGAQREMQVSVKDIVLFSKYAGTEVEDGLLLMNEDDILAIKA